jgi:hypothetical protein
MAAGTAAAAVVDSPDVTGWDDGLLFILEKRPVSEDAERTEAGGCDEAKGTEEEDLPTSLERSVSGSAAEADAETEAAPAAAAFVS